jgi:hypothetical protein
MSPSREVSAQDLIHILQRPELSEELSLWQWDELLGLARGKNLLARLAESCKPQLHAGKLPEQVVVHLNAALVLSQHQMQAIRWEVQHIANALDKLDIPLVLLKGAAYVFGELPAATGRLFADIDLLVPRHAINHVEAALMLHGWTSSGTDAYDQRYYRQWMHEIPPMVHRMRGTAIDVHHNILPSTALACPDITLILACARNLPGTRLRILAPCDMVLHSATHLFYEGELHNGLRDLLDLDALLRDFSARDSAFWQRLCERAKETGLVLPLHFALRYTQRFLSTDIPSDVLNSMENVAHIGALAQGMLDTAYTRILMSSHPNSAEAGLLLSELFLYVRAHLLRMPLKLLLPHLARKAFLRMYKNTSRSA